MAKKKPAALTSPLTVEEHVPILNAILEGCQMTDEECAKCERCNINVDQAKAANEDQRRIAAAIKREFFPDQP